MKYAVEVEKEKVRHEFTTVVLPDSVLQLKTELVASILMECRTQCANFAAVAAK